MHNFVPSCQLISCATPSSREHATKPLCIVVPTHQAKQLDGIFGHAMVLLLVERQRLQALCSPLCSTIYSALHCTPLHSTLLHCTTLHCTPLHCTTLPCTPLCCTSLLCTPFSDGQVSVCRRIGSGLIRRWSSDWLPTGKNVRHACRRRCSARYTPTSASHHCLHSWPLPAPPACLAYTVDGWQM